MICDENIDSSLLDRTTYMGFCVDWIIELFGTLVCLIMLILSVSFTLGVCLYINAMVTDMEIILNDDDSNGPLERMEWWSRYVQEIAYHIKVIGCILRKSHFFVIDPI